MNPLEILIEEYKTLREESLTAMKNMISVLSFGIAAIGAIISFALAKQVSSFSSTILVFGVPAISGCILEIWLGEYWRMQRVGKYLVNLEDEINRRSSNDQLLYWEHYLRIGKKNMHMSSPYNMVVIFFVAISLISFVIGMVNSPHDGLYLFYATLPWGGEIAVGITAHFIVLVYAIIRMYKWKQPNLEPIIKKSPSPSGIG